MKKQQEKKTEIIRMRVSRGTKNRILWLANQYAGGNVSKWLEYAGINCVRKYLIRL